MINKNPLFLERSLENCSHSHHPSKKKYFVAKFTQKCDARMNAKQNKKKNHFI